MGQVESKMFWTVSKIKFNHQSFILLNVQDILGVWALIENLRKNISLRMSNPTDVYSLF